MSPSVTLTAYNTDFAAEAEFDQWIAYVAANIDAATGLDVSVDAFAFTGRHAGGDHDEIDGTDEEILTITEALRELWERGCADSFEVQS